MRAKDIMRKPVVHANEKDNIETLVTILVKNNISGVPIIDDTGRVCGMVTEQDLITAEKGINFPSYIEFLESILFIDGEKKYHPENIKMLMKTTLKEIMSTPVYCVTLDATLSEIASIMVNRHINRVPVVNHEQKLVGIIGRTDLLPMLIQY
ncbi:MAG: CBS domain-containing protein [Cellulosilyticaceae bacterium]